MAVRSAIRHPTFWTTLASALVLVALLSLLVTPGFASEPTGTRKIDGEGTATTALGNRHVQACTFQVHVQATVAETAKSGPVTGTFDCEMSDPSVALGVPFRELDGTVTSFSDLKTTEGTEEVQIKGSAVLTLPDGGTMTGVPFHVRTGEGDSEGSAGPAMLRLVLEDDFDGERGDIIAGNGQYDMQRQTVEDGSIKITYKPGPSPTPSPSTPSSSPSPTPSSPSPTPSSPSPTPTGSQAPPPETGGPPLPPEIGPPPYDPTGPWSTARLMAILASLSPTGSPQPEDILSVVGPFPVAGLAAWSSDWHAYRCCPTPHLHQGVDLMAAQGTPLVAAADGYISQIVDNPDSSGLGVEITDADGTEYFYAHLSAFAGGLRLGQLVLVGDVIGYVGDTGNPLTGAYHLHFEVQPHGVPVPPIPYLNRWLAEAEQKAYQLGGTGFFTEETFPYAITDAELQAWMDQASSLLGGNPSSSEGSADPELSAAGLPTVSPSPDAAAAGGSRTAEPIGAEPAGFMATPAGVGVLAAGMLLVFLVLPGVHTGRRQARRELAAVTGRAHGPGKVEATDGTSTPPGPARRTRRRPGPHGGSAAVAAR